MKTESFEYFNDSYIKPDVEIIELEMEGVILQSSGSGDLIVSPEIPFGDEF